MVVTVNVETMLPAVFTVAGEKLHVAPVGNPVHANATVELEEKPFSGVRVTVPVAVAPGVTVMVVGETARVKSGAGALAVTLRVALLLVAGANRIGDRDTVERAVVSGHSCRGGVAGGGGAGDRSGVSGPLVSWCWASRSRYGERCCPDQPPLLRIEVASG